MTPARRSLPYTSVLALALVLLPSASAQNRRLRSWSDKTPVRSSEHYRIQTDLPLEQARAYGRHLDRMYAEYAKRLASLPPRGPEQLDVYIFAKRSDYLSTLRHRWGIDGAGTGGMFFVRQPGSGLAFWTESLPERRIHHVIQHEGFHQFAFSRFADDLPLWLNEGLAEFFGESVLVGDRLVLGQTSPRIIGHVKAMIESERHIPFLGMLTTDARKWQELVGAGAADRYYNQAWSMVHFLVYGDGGRYREPFERFLRLINHGTPADAAFVEVFGADVGAFERRWKDYALQAKPSAFMTALERIQFLAEGALELSYWRAEEAEKPPPMPASLAALREELRQIAFVQKVRHHGHTIERKADDDANFEIPMDDLVTTQPVFIVTAPRTRHSTRKDRLFETRHPMPPAIRSENLEPLGLEIAWIRNRETGALRYEVVLK